MSNEITKILSLPNATIKAAQTGEDLIQVHDAQKSQIIALITQNIEKSSLSAKTKETVIDILNNLQPLDVVEPPVYESSVYVQPINQNV